MEEQAEQHQKWWQQIKNHRVAIGVVAIILAVVIALIIVEVRLYGTGFAGKTLWDWLQLLGVVAIPVVVVFGAAWFTRVQHQRDQRLASEQHDHDQILAEQRAKSERGIALDNQREAALKEYIEKISELLLHENLRKSKPDGEVRKIARVLTLTVLPRLDGGRKRSVLQFLYESGLLDKDKCIVDVTEADLSQAYLSKINLSKAEMSKTILDGADLAKANLSGANLTGSYLLSANLNIANLSGTNLTEANFTGADLSGANFTGTNLHKTVLRYANVSGAIFIGTGVTDEQLKTAKGYQELRWSTRPGVPERSIRRSHHR